jgi:hypothetical protein
VRVSACLWFHSLTCESERLCETCNTSCHTDPDAAWHGPKPVNGLVRCYTYLEQKKQKEEEKKEKEKEKEKQKEKEKEEAEKNAEEKLDTESKSETSKSEADSEERTEEVKHERRATAGRRSTISRMFTKNKISDDPSPSRKDSASEERRDNDESTKDAKDSKDNAHDKKYSRKARIARAFTKKNEAKTSNAKSENKGEEVEKMRMKEKLMEIKERKKKQ